MEIIAAATAVFALLLPFINAAINRVNWTSKQKSLVAWGTSILVAIAFVLITGGIGNLWQLVIAAPAIFGYQQAIYTFLVKNIATKFEALTDPNSTVITPNEDSTVNIITDATADHGTAIIATPPVTVVPAPTSTPEEIITDSPAKG